MKSVWSRRNVPALMIAVVSALVVGCGGSESDGSSRTGAVGGDATAPEVQPEQSQPSTVPPPTAAGTTVGISGTPATSVKVGERYSFTPRASTSSTGIGFSITNKPSWATFDTVTGRLQGVPTADHAGVYRGIVISLSNGVTTAALPAFDINVVAVAPANGGVAALSWQAPSQNADGTPLTDLGGYRIYHGSSAESLGNVIDVPNPQATSYTVNNLMPGTHYFAMTAYSKGGVESERTGVTSKTVM